MQEIGDETGPRDRRDKQLKKDKGANVLELQIRDHRDFGHGRIPIHTAAAIVEHTASCLMLNGNESLYSAQMDTLL